MSGILNDLQGVSSSLNNVLTGGASTNPVNGQLSQQSGVNQTGFNTVPIPSGEQNPLPSSTVPTQRLAATQRDIAHWFVPEVGVVNMYINPQSIAYNQSKAITKERTKGGFIIQYWGEELGTLAISGHTGSSGVEGLQVLLEVYRAEQILFDPIALTMAADSSITGLNDLIDQSLGNLGGLGSVIAGATTGVLGLDPASQTILPRSVPSLASLALGIEFYYGGWVHRGYFNSFNFTESADRMGLFAYDIQFTVTQRRGYRYNQFSFQHSAISGPSNATSVPLSYSTLASAVNTNPVQSFAAITTGKGPFGI